MHPRVAGLLEQHAALNVFDLSLDVHRAVRHPQRNVHEVHPHQNGVPRRRRLGGVQSVHVANEYPLGAEDRLPLFQNAGERFLVRVVLQTLQVEAVHSPFQPNFYGRRHGVLRRGVVGVARCERFVLRVVQRRGYRGQRVAYRLMERRGGRRRRHCLAKGRRFANVSSLAHRFVRFIRLLRGHGLVVQGPDERVQRQIEDQAHVTTVSLAHQRGEIVQRSQLSVQICQALDVRVILGIVGRREYGIQTDPAHAQLFQIVQTHGDAAEIADSVAALRGILERGREYLVEHAALPPLDWRVTPVGNELFR